METLYAVGNVNKDMVQHVPVLESTVTLEELGISSIEELLSFADGPSLAGAVREGIVFKRADDKFSFKVISNEFLANQVD